MVRRAKPRCRLITGKQSLNEPGYNRHSTKDKDRKAKQAYCKSAGQPPSAKPKPVQFSASGGPPTDKFWTSNDHNNALVLTDEGMALLGHAIYIRQIGSKWAYSVPSIPSRGQCRKLRQAKRAAIIDLGAWPGGQLTRLSKEQFQALVEELVN